MPSTKQLTNASRKIYEDVRRRTPNGDADNTKYYNEYCNIHVANVILLEKIKETVEEKEDLLKKLKRLQNSAEQVLSTLSHKNTGKRRRIRRKKNEIVRAFKCPIEKCKKEYGTEGSLQQHLKTKHPKYFEKHCSSVKIGGSIAGQSEAENSGI